MKNKKKVWIIGLCFIIAGYFALSLCDFMYIRADKYPAFIRTIFFSDDKNVAAEFRYGYSGSPSFSIISSS